MIFILFRFSFFLNGDNPHIRIFKTKIKNSSFRCLNNNTSDQLFFLMANQQCQVTAGTESFIIIGSETCSTTDATIQDSVESSRTSQTCHPGNNKCTYRYKTILRVHFINRVIAILVLNKSDKKCIKPQNEKKTSPSEVE